MGIRTIIIAVAAAGVALAATGCSGSGSSKSGGSGSSSSGTGSGTGTGSGSTGSASGGTAGQLTGTQLTKALLPASDFPVTFAVSQQGSADSGNSLERAAAAYSPSSISCTDWDNYFTGSGFGETAYTSGSVADSTRGQTYGQIVYQFRSAGAASQFFSGVQSLSGRCRSFVASGGGSARVTMQGSTGPSLDGHQSYWIDQATTVVGASSKINTLFALDGTDVIAISASGVGSAPPSSPGPSALLQKLITSVHAHH